MIDVSIIIVTYNSFGLARDCLESLRVRCGSVPYEVILVDNASCEDGLEALERDFPETRVIRNPRNLGFGAANNIGYRQSHGRYLFFLNPDTVVLNDAVGLLYRFMESRAAEGIGAAGAWLLAPDLGTAHSRGSFDGHTARALIAGEIRRITRNLLPGVRRSRLRSKGGPAARTAEVTNVDWITGADLFCRRDAFEAVGGFDESFFLYSEEVDLQYRMRGLGWGRAILSGPRIVHLQGRTEEMSQSGKVHFYRGFLTYLARHRSIVTLTATFVALKSLWLAEALAAALLRRTFASQPVQALARVTYPRVSRVGVHRIAASLSP